MQLDKTVTRVGEEIKRLRLKLARAGEVIRKQREALNLERGRNRRLELRLVASQRQFEASVQHLESQLFDANLRADNWQGRYNAVAMVQSQQFSNGGEQQALMNIFLDHTSNPVLRECTCVPGRQHALLRGDGS